MDNSEKLTKTYDNTILQPKVVGPLIILAALLISLTYYQGLTYIKNPLFIAIIVISSILSSFIPFNPQRFLKHPALYLTFFHIILALMLIFVFPTLSPAMLFWLLMTYITQYYHNKVGLFMSLSGLLITLITSTLLQKPPFSWTLMLTVLPWFVVISAVAMVVSRVILISREARLMVTSKLMRAEYEHQRVISLINSMVEAVIAVDDQGIVNIYNSAAIELLDTNVDLLSQNINSIMHLTDINHNEINIIDMASKAPKALSKAGVYLDISATDRRALEIDISRISIFSPESQQKGYTFLIHDVTAEKSLNEERDDFISVVSHELRTPIAIAEANVAMAQLTAKNPSHTPQEISESLANTHKQVMFLSEMINDLATLSRAERAGAEVAVESFDITRAMTDIDSIYRVQAENKGLSFNVLVDQNIPAFNASELYIKEILQNLISNAIKYTSSGGVKVVAHTTPESTLMIAVTDTGIGIKKAEQHNLFQKFWRSENTRTKETDGTGLGLYISDKLARQIGAKITLVSDDNKGSTFTLTIPIPKGSSDSQLTARRRNREQAGTESEGIVQDNKS